MPPSQPQIPACGLAITIAESEAVNAAADTAGLIGYLETANAHPDGPPGCPLAQTRLPPPRSRPGWLPAACLI
jgi:hypothetical protein